MQPLVVAMTDAWEKMSERFAAYSLVIPGTTAFRCLASECTEHCCNRYTVNLSAHDVDRVVRVSGLAPRAFLECEDGEPLALPLAQPYILARAGGTCVFLAGDMSCGHYEGRPNACRMYPHFVLFVDRETGKPTYGDTTAIARSFADWLAGGEASLVPVLMRHRACPGFEGARKLGTDEWLEILRGTARIQYAPEAPDDWPMATAPAGVTVAAGDRLPA